METDIEAVGGQLGTAVQLLCPAVLHQEYARPHTLVTSNAIAIFGIQAKGTDDGVTQRQRCHGESAGIRQIMINNNTITSNVLSGTSSKWYNRIAQGPRHKSVIVFRTKESMPTIPFYGRYRLL
jgi:hypothetical protein